MHIGSNVLIRAIFLVDVWWSEFDYRMNLFIDFQSESHGDFCQNNACFYCWVRCFLLFLFTTTCYRLSFNCFDVRISLKNLFQAFIRYVAPTSEIVLIHLIVILSKYLSFDCLNFFSTVSQKWSFGCKSSLDPKRNFSLWWKNPSWLLSKGLIVLSNFTNFKCK